MIRSASRLSTPRTVIGETGRNRRCSNERFDKGRNRHCGYCRGAQPCLTSSRALLRSACSIRVWNGIFAAGDWRAKRGLKTMSPRRDRKSETTTREKWAQKGLSANELSVAGFGRLGGGAGKFREPVSGVISLISGNLLGKFDAFPAKTAMATRLTRQVQRVR